MASLNAPQQRPTGWPAVPDRRPSAKAGPIPSHIWPALIVAYATLLPREFKIGLAGIDFTPYRLALVLVFPMVLSVLRKLPLRVSPIDYVAAFAALWFIISLSVVHSIMDGLVTGAAQALDLFLAYLTGRAAIRSTADLRRLFLAFLPGLFVSALVIAIESITHQVILRRTIASWLGLPRFSFDREVRWGLMRAVGAFPHPILGGTMLASMLPLAWYLTTRLRDKAIGLFVTAACVFTVSSTSLLNLVINAGLIGALFLQRITRLPVFLVGSLYLAASAVFVSVYSNSGLLSVLLRYATINSTSGYYRRMIWKYAGAEAQQHPIFGIGLNDWSRPRGMVSDSVDAHWLILTMRNGYPQSIAILIMLLGAVLLVVRGASKLPVREANPRYAIAFALFSLGLSGISVAIWEGLNAWMIMMMGMAISLASYLPAKVAGPVRPGRRGPPPRHARAAPTGNREVRPVR